MIKLSTIVSVYNKENALRQTLQSIVDNHELSEDEYECILIDDESTDSSPDICKEFCEKYSYFKYFRIFNNHIPSPSCARNIGLELSKGKIIHFLDSDDGLCQDFYGICSKNMILNDIDILIRGFLRVNDGNWSTFMSTSFENKLYGPSLQCVLFSRKIIGDIRFKDVAFEDIIFTCEVLMNNDYIFFDNRDNCQSYVYYEDLASARYGYKKMVEEKFGPYDINEGGIADNELKYIVNILQVYPKYPLRLVNGEIQEKYINI